MSRKMPILRLRLGTVERQCRGCDRWLALDDFNRTTSNRTGFASVCRTCSSALTREWRASDAGRARHREYLRQPRVAAKVSVRKQTRSAIAAGNLPTSRTCQACGEPTPEVHHLSYETHTAIIWLCRACHRAAHKGAGLHASAAGRAA